MFVVAVVGLVELVIEGKQQMCCLIEVLEDFDGGFVVGKMVGFVLVWGFGEDVGDFVDQAPSLPSMLNYFELH
jgi:hypothetical protein